MNNNGSQIKVGRKISFSVLFLVFVLSSMKIVAQKSRLDSLKRIICSSEQNILKINALSETSQIIAAENPDSALLLGEQAVLLSKKLNYQLGELWAEFRIGRAYFFKKSYQEALDHYGKVIVSNNEFTKFSNTDEKNSFNSLMGKTYGNMAIIHMNQSDYQNALFHSFQALKFSRELGDKSHEAGLLNNIANVYFDQSDFPNALQYYLNALKLSEELNDKNLLATTNFGIARTYSIEKDYTRALLYSEKSLKLAKEINNKTQICNVLNNIAGIFYSKLDHSKAMEYYHEVLKVGEELNDLPIKSSALSNIGNVYNTQKQYPKALEYYLKGLEIGQIMEDKKFVGTATGNIGILYYNMHDYKMAEKYLKDGIILLNEINVGNSEKDFHFLLSLLYEETKRPAQALFHYKKFIALRDTIFSQENNKKLIRSELNYEYAKKKAVEDARHKAQIESQKLIASEKAKKHNIILSSVLTGMILVIFFAGFIFRSLRIASKQKSIIEQKNVETERQKREIELRQKEILDSIHYARRIQMAQVPSENRVYSMLKKAKGEN